MIVTLNGAAGSGSSVVGVLQGLAAALQGSYVAWQAAAVRRRAKTREASTGNLIMIYRISLFVFKAFHHCIIGIQGIWYTKYSCTVQVCSPVVFPHFALSRF